MQETISKFLDRVAVAAQEGTLVKMTLSKPMQKKDELRNIYVKPVLIKDARLFAFTYRYEHRDEVKNYSEEQMLELLTELLQTRFLNSVLFTVNEDVSLLVNTKGNATILVKKVAEVREQNLEHDRTKKRFIDPTNPWWFQLGLVTREGKVLADMQHKFKQICKYTEIVEGLLKNMHFGEVVRIADMGAGKGYLTFALHEYLTKTLKLNVDIKGVEIRPELVAKINGIIRDTKLKGIEFVEGSIESFQMQDLDVLIALHACNTATDDAIAAGIRSGAQLIVCAPCCHKQIRQQMEISGVVDPVTQYGIFMEREAAMITDSMRAMIMEYYGYKTQIMEFIEMEHTPKNILLVGRKTDAPVEKEIIAEKIKAIKQQYGIKAHYLETAMGLNL